MSKSSKNGKVGRPKEKDSAEHFNLNVANRSKLRAKKLAKSDGVSVSRLFEILIDRRWKRRATA